MKNLPRIIMVIIALLCIVALVYLVFFFGDDLRGESEVTTLSQKDYTITFDTDTLKYKKDIDFLDGVTATDENGEDLTSDITVSIKQGTNISKKTLVYSINKASYKILTFERGLDLGAGYTGPSIAIVGTGFEIPLDKINNLSAELTKTDIIETNDGFGGTCSISAKLPSDNVTIGDYVATVTAQNIFGDTATAKLSVTITEPESSIIKLTTSSITINKNEEFNPYDYIKPLYYEDYEDITSLIIPSDTVDTSKSGVYTVEYRVKEIVELKDEVAYLYVTVN